MARLTLKDRKLLKKMYDVDERTIVMAAKLDCSMTAIYDELKRGYAGTDDHDRPIYDPDLAQRKVNANVRRCGGKNRRRTPTLWAGTRERGGTPAASGKDGAAHS